MLNMAQQRAGQKILVILMNGVVQVDCVVVDFNIIPVIIIRPLAVHGDVIAKPIIANRRAVGVGVGVGVGVTRPRAAYPQLNIGSIDQGSKDIKACSENNRVFRSCLAPPPRTSVSS